MTNSQVLWQIGQDDCCLIILIYLFLAEKVPCFTANLGQKYLYPKLF
jgi:hypothetical protein